MQIYRILANRATFKRILHTNRKGGFHMVFHIPNDNKRMNRSPFWAYFPIDLHTSFFQYNIRFYHPLPYSPAQGMQTNVPFRTRARCSATISPQLAHWTVVKIFACTGISGLTSLIMNNSSIGILRIVSMTAACRSWNSFCSSGVDAPPSLFPGVLMPPGRCVVRLVPGAGQAGSRGWISGR